MITYNYTLEIFNLFSKKEVIYQIEDTVQRSN
jgi:hypothetical protein